jgi:hypothetical protein
MKLPQHRKLVRVVRDIRDPAQDYYITEPHADELYRMGVLALTKVRGSFGAASDAWVYVTQAMEPIK